MLRKMVSPRLSAAFRYFEAAEETSAAAQAREGRAEINKLSLRTKISLREEARALRKRGLELRSRGRNKVRSIKGKWLI